MSAERGRRRLKVAAWSAGATLLAGGNAYLSYTVNQLYGSNQQNGNLYNQNCGGLNSTGFPSVYACPTNTTNSTAFEDSLSYSFNETCAAVGNVVCETGKAAGKYFWSAVGTAAGAVVAATAAVATACSPTSKPATCAGFVGLFRKKPRDNYLIVQENAEDKNKDKSNELTGSQNFKKST